MRAFSFLAALPWFPPPHVGKVFRRADLVAAFYSVMGSMPNAAPRPCSYPGCGVLTTVGRCDRHRNVEKKKHDQMRGNSTERGYGYRWQKASKAFLRAHPLCQCPECDEGRVRVLPSTVVDHITPHRGDMALFWDSSNWQAMSKDCHDAKTARDDGGFGNRTGTGG